jgi:hypothetical protein
VAGRLLPYRLMFQTEIKSSKWSNSRARVNGTVNILVAKAVVFLASSWASFTTGWTWTVLMIRHDFVFLCTTILEGFAVCANFPLRVKWGTGRSPRDFFAPFALFVVNCFLWCGSIALCLFAPFGVIKSFVALRTAAVVQTTVTLTV